MTTIFDGSKQDLLDAVASGHVEAQDAYDEFAVRHAEGREGYDDYAPAAEVQHDASEVQYTGGDTVPGNTAPEVSAVEQAAGGDLGGTGEVPGPDAGHEEHVDAGV